MLRDVSMGNDVIDAFIQACRQLWPDREWEAVGITRRIAAVSRFFATDAERTFRELGLTSAGFDVLATLHASRLPYQMTPTMLHRRLMMSSAGISARLDHLEAEGLIERSPNPADGRATIVALKPAGVGLVNTAVSRMLGRQAYLASALGARAQRIATLLGPILGYLDAVNPRAPEETTQPVKEDASGPSQLQDGGRRATALFQFVEHQWADERADLDPTLVALTGRTTLVTRSLRLETARTLRSVGMDLATFDVVFALLLAPEPHELSPTQLAQSLAMSSGGMTGRLDSVEAAGLVARRPHRRDRRSIVIRLTPLGVERAGTAVEPYRSRHAEIVSVLAARARRTLDADLRVLLDTVEEASAPAPV
jgi:DNA-binding MarR family transcriptional regulator